VKALFIVIALVALLYLRVKVLKSLLGIKDQEKKSGVHVVKGDGGVTITSTGGQTIIEVEDGGYVKARVNGKDVEVYSPPGSGPKRVVF
jgi:hypothetical protein